MATLQIRKETSKVWRHVPSDELPYIVSKLYIKSEGDNIRVVELGGSQRGIYNFADVSVYDIGGVAETFTSASELMQRLEALGYIGFFYEGEVSPSLLISSDVGNAITLGTDGKLYVSVSGGGAVDSVNGQTGVVVLDADDISDATTTNKFVTVTEKNTWNSKQDALGFIPENVANKENTNLDTSATKYPTNRLVKEVTDSKVDKITTAGVERVYTINADGSQGTKATSDLGGGKNIYAINFSFGSAWLGNINASWRTSLYATNVNIYNNSVGTNINFDGTTNTLVAADNRITKWTLPFNCKLKDVQSYMAGQLNVNLDFKILYWEAPTAFGQTNYTYLGRVFFTASGVGGKIFPTISELNTTTTLNKGGHIVIIWFNNTANPTFSTSLIQPIFEEV